jgi:hypothetical protein
MLFSSLLWVDPRFGRAGVRRQPFAMREYGRDATQRLRSGP